MESLQGFLANHFDDVDDQKDGDFVLWNLLKLSDLKTSSTASTPGSRRSEAFRVSHSPPRHITASFKNSTLKSWLHHVIVRNSKIKCVPLHSNILAPNHCDLLTLQTSFSRGARVLLRFIPRTSAQFHQLIHSMTSFWVRHKVHFTVYTDNHLFMDPRICTLSEW